MIREREREREGGGGAIRKKFKLSYNLFKNLMQKREREWWKEIKIERQTDRQTNRDLTNIKST
jgi:hypothetical protein